MNATKRSPATLEQSRGLKTVSLWREALNDSQYTTGPFEILQRLESVRSTGSGSFVARCPAHDDRRPSLSIKLESDRDLLHCFAGCSADAVAGAVGLRLADLFTEPHARIESARNRRVDRPRSRPSLKRQVVRTFDRRSGGKWSYTDEAGRVVATKYRTDFRVEYDDGTIESEKTFRVEPKGVDLPLYRLPDVVSATRQSWPLYLLEGEAKADRLSDLLRHEWGIDAVATSFGGLSTFGRRQLLRFAPECTSVVVIPDQDEAGQRQADRVVSELVGIGASVSTVSLAHLLASEVQS